MAIFDQDAEQMDRGELAQLQLERLQATLTRVYKNVKFYKKKFDEIGFLPEDCQSLEHEASSNSRESGHDLFSLTEQRLPTDKG